MFFYDKGGVTLFRKIMKGRIKVLTENPFTVSM